MAKETVDTLEGFLETWQETEEKNKAAFNHLRAYLEKKDGVLFEFIPRPGVTYSLRVAHPNQKDKSLFAMIDVIEDNPRWLSICFYGAMITDPEEKGDFVPEGLLGEDAICFDIDAWENQLITYVEKRLEEAWQYTKNE